MFSQSASRPPRTPLAAIALLVALFTLWHGPAKAGGGDASTYLYQRVGAEQAGAISVSWESAIGTREARPFGDKGIEQGIRSTLDVTDAISVDAWGGVLLDPNGEREQSFSFSLEAGAKVLKQEAQGIDLRVRAGYQLDFQGVSMPRASVSLSKDWGALNVSAAGQAEVPLAEERDAVDLIVMTGVSYAVKPQVRVGLELAGEDLEGFWDEEEAEGGARLVAGPAARLVGNEHWDLRLHAGAVVLAPNQAAAPANENGDSEEVGFLGRASLRYSF